MIILALAGGLLGLFASLALRTSQKPRTREGIADDRFIYLSLPGFSLFLLGIGVLGLALPGAGGGATGALLVALSVLAAVTAVVGAVMSLWGLFSPTVPDWALPPSKRGRK